MAQPKIQLIFCRSGGGREPVREWLKGLSPRERKAIGLDLMRVQFRWPIGMPLCRSLGSGLWEVRTNLATHRIARVFICFEEEDVVALHGCIKKTQKTPKDDLEIARDRQKKVIAS
jgi:phage-related protein